MRHHFVVNATKVGNLWFETPGGGATDLVGDVEFSGVVQDAREHIYALLDNDRQKWQSWTVYMAHDPSTTVVAYGVAFMAMVRADLQRQVQFFHAISDIRPADLPAWILAISQLLERGPERLTLDLRKAAEGQLPPEEVLAGIVRRVEDGIDRVRSRGSVKAPVAAPTVGAVEHDCLGGAAVAWLAMATQQASVQASWIVRDKVANERYVSIVEPRLPEYRFASELLWASGQLAVPGTVAPDVLVLPGPSAMAPPMPVVLPALQTDLVPVAPPRVAEPKVAGVSRSAERPSDVIAVLRSPAGAVVALALAGSLGYLGGTIPRPPAAPAPVGPRQGGGASMTVAIPSASEPTGRPPPTGDPAGPIPVVVAAPDVPALHATRPDTGSDASLRVADPSRTDAAAHPAVAVASAVPATSAEPIHGAHAHPRDRPANPPAEARAEDSGRGRPDSGTSEPAADQDPPGADGPVTLPGGWVSRPAAEAGGTSPHEEPSSAPRGANPTLGGGGSAGQGGRPVQSAPTSTNSTTSRAATTAIEGGASQAAPAPASTTPPGGLRPTQAAPIASRDAGSH